MVNGLAVLVWLAAASMLGEPQTDLIVVFPGWACAASAYEGVVRAASAGRRNVSALYLPLFDDASVLRDWSAARACGAACVDRRGAEQDELVDAAIRSRFEPAAHRLVFFGHSAGSMTARRAADRWAAHVHSLVFYGGAFKGQGGLPYRFFCMHGGANLFSRDGSLQLAALLDFVRESEGADVRFPDPTERSQRLAFALLPGATHFSCAAPEAVARSTRWQGYTGMAPLVQPTVDRRADIGRLLRAFIDGKYGDEPEAGSSAVFVSRWAPLASAQADAEWLAAAWWEDVGVRPESGAAPRVVLHADVPSFERAAVRPLAEGGDGAAAAAAGAPAPAEGAAPGVLSSSLFEFHAVQPNGPFGEWWLKTAGPRPDAAALNRRAWAWAAEHSATLVPANSSSGADGGDGASGSREGGERDAPGALFEADATRAGNFTDTPARAGPLAAWREAPPPTLPRVRSAVVQLAAAAGGDGAAVVMAKLLSRNQAAAFAIGPVDV